MNADLFDSESGLPGPIAFRYAVTQEYLLARKQGALSGLAILRVKQPSAMVAKAIGQAFKARRSRFDAPGRIDARTFGVVIGVPADFKEAVTDALLLLEEAATAAATSGSGDVRARVYWLSTDHVSDEEWYRGAVRWDV